MNSQWMTTLFSKGIELEQNLRKGFDQAQSKVRDQVKKELESRGLNMNASDLTALLEEIAPGASRAALSGALDFFRPFTAGLGFRVSRLADTQIEIVIPLRPRAKDDQDQLHEGVLITAGIEAGKLLWARHAPLGKFQATVKHISFQQMKRPRDEVRVRLELDETTRESGLAVLRQNHKYPAEMNLRFVDHDEQTVAEMELTLELQYTPSLEAPAE